MKTYSYLALGDSYTIGEQVNLVQSFPYQAVHLLRKAGHNFCAPEIIAKTGWTTDELKHAIDETELLTTYDFVSLLVGVNNQYRGLSGDDFRGHLRCLLEWGLDRVDGLENRLILLSIPDWSVTPFAVGRDRQMIRQEIDMYNFICQAEAEHFNVGFIDITTAHREDAHNEEFLADDKLHPSGLEYAKWANQLFNKIIIEL